MFSFRKIQEADLEMILRWRMRPEITNFQFTDVPFDLQAQLRWFENKVNVSDWYWIIESDQDPIGLINIADYDRAHRRTSWGYYIGELNYWPLGGLVPPFFYNYLFYERFPDLQKVMAEVMYHNTNVVKIHQMHGYRMVGILQRHILKYRSWYDVVVMELHREEWDKRKKKFGHYRACFD